MSIPEYNDPIYLKRFKFPKWNIKPSVFSGDTDVSAKILRYLFPAWAAEDHLKAVEKYSNNKVKLQEEYSKLLDQAAQETWGRSWRVTDYKVSGIGSDEFSNKMKNKLRMIVNGISKCDVLINSHKQAVKKVKTIKVVRKSIEEKKAMFKNVTDKLNKIATLITADDEYDQQELSRHYKETKQLEKQPSEELGENEKEWFTDMAKHPELIAERIGWLLSGNYGRGPMIKAEQILSMNKNANKVAGLSILIAGCEWRVPGRRAVVMWKKLSTAQQQNLKKAIEKEIEDYNAEKE
jgi:hypothetical protein